MRGMLLKSETVEYIVAVEYLVEESGEFYEGGLYQWEGTFVPGMPVSLSADSYVLELEDGRRGRIAIFHRYAAPAQPTVYRFRGHAGLHG